MVYNRPILQFRSIRHMRTKSIRLLVAAAAFSVFAAFMHAGPGLQYWQTLRDRAQFKDLKAGDRIVYVCNQCKTVTEATVESSEKAMDLCKEGATVSCPKCKMETKVVARQKRGDSPTHTEITYENEKGEECMFIAKAPEKK